MLQSVSAHFDGKVIVPEQPLDLPVGQPLRIVVEVVAETAPRFESLLRYAADLSDAPSDLSAQHDHYLYGCPKQ